jgi:hypothetical protein
MAICFALAGEQNKTKTAEGEIKKKTGRLTTTPHTCRPTTASHKCRPCRARGGCVCVYAGACEGVCMYGRGRVFSMFGLVEEDMRIP